MSHTKIVMLENRRGSDDGFTVRRFEKGATYEINIDIGEMLAADFIQKGYAKKKQDIPQSLSAATIRQHIPNQAMTGFSIGSVMRELRNEP